VPVKNIASPPPGVKKISRRLRPEVAAALAARKRQAQLEELYQRPVQELDSEELAQMRAAFFRR
jgi:hypothetical protein